MSKVTISEAAKLAGISRSTLYRNYINTGQISIEVIDDKKLIDRSEIIRVFGNIHIDGVYGIQSNTINKTSEDNSKDKLIELLEQQLKQAKEREEWLKERQEHLMLQIEKSMNILEDKSNKSPESPTEKKAKGFFKFFKK